MGFDLNRFQGAVDEELICPICSGVLENPIQVYILFFIIIVHQIDSIVFILC